MNLDNQLPPGADWIGRKFADLERAIRELGAARAIEATIGDPGDVGDLRDAVGSLPAPAQVARRDQANTYAAAAEFVGAVTADTYLEMVEQASDPAAPAANRVRIYPKDVGGKTALFALFPTGSAVQIAVEP